MKLQGKRYGMWRSPNKKQRRTRHRDHLTFGKFPAPGSGHSGSVPKGKVSKNKRFALQPPGNPSGVHIPKEKAQDLYGRGCLCGKCSTK